MIEKIVNSYKMLTSHEGRLFTYAFAYSLIMGIAPFLILAVFMASRFFLDVDTIVSFVSHYVPEALILPFINYIQGSAPNDLAVIISLSTVSLWVASRTVYSFLLESSRLDSIGVQNFILRIAGMIYFVLYIALGLLVVFLFSYFPLPPIPYVPQAVVVTVLMMMFYRTISFRFTRVRDVWIGAVFAMVGLLLLGKLFFLYVNQFSNYETIYGPMASIMILLISGYLISWIIYAGYCINVSFHTVDSQDMDSKKWLERVAISFDNFVRRVRK